VSSEEVEEIGMSICTVDPFQSKFLIVFCGRSIERLARRSPPSAADGSLGLEMVLSFLLFVGA
jgi:hypothetical protein